MSIFNYSKEMTNKLLEVSKFQAWTPLDPAGRCVKFAVSSCVRD